MRYSFIILIVWAALTPSAFAAQYDIDTAHSSVGFKVKHLMTFSQGHFDEFEGKFDFNEKKPELGNAEFMIKTKSINTKNSKRDDHLRSEDFFDADKHPTIQFKSTNVKTVKKNRYKVMGDLTIRGTTKPVTLDVEYKGTSPDGFGNTKSGFSATTKINRKDYGIAWNKQLDKGGFILGDDVMVEIEIEGTLKN